MVDTVVIQSTPPVTPEDHDQKMMAKVDAANATPPDQGTEGTPPEERPQWLPEKFKSPEDMAKAYAELESKLGQKPADKPADAPAAEPQAEPQEVEKALSEKGLDMQDFSAEFAEKGELSPESYEKLQKAGYDRNLVDQYIEGQRAIAAQYENTVMGEVGGREKYNEITTWAKANLTPAEINAFNAAVSSGSQEQAKLAVLGLGSKYQQAVGTDPQRLIGGQNVASSSDSFESMAQVTAAMKDPKYKTDPAFRAKVQAKLARSNVM
jgi:hypothetical protein